MKNEFKIGDLVCDSSRIFYYTEEIILEVIEVHTHKINPTKIICVIKGEDKHDWINHFQYFSGEIKLRKDIMNGLFVGAITTHLIYKIIIEDDKIYYSLKDSDWRMDGSLVTDCWIETDETIILNRDNKLNEILELKNIIF